MGPEKSFLHMIKRAREREGGGVEYEKERNGS